MLTIVSLLKIDEVLYDNKSDVQHIQVFQNNRFGRVLTLDGVVQTTEGDEFIYHEMLEPRAYSGPRCGTPGIDCWRW